MSTETLKFFEEKSTEAIINWMINHLTEGEVAWTSQSKPISQFKDYCTDEDRELFQILKEENEEAFSNPPTDVLEVAADYVTSGLVSPIPIKSIPQVPDVSDPTPVTQTVEITESMMKALKVQQNSGAYMQQNYPELYAKGLTMFPVFIYGADGNKVLFMSAVVEDDKLTLVKDFVNKALINNKFRKITEAISNAIAAGLYTPTDNIRTELSDSLTDPEIKAKIKFIYDQVKVTGINFYGTIEDEPENMSQDSFVDIQDEVEPENMFQDEFPVYSLDNWPDTRAGMSDDVQLKTKPKKKPTEMNETELKEHMTNIGYPHHLYYPEVYTNSLGVENIRYKKRETPIDNEEYEMIQNVPFVDFQGKPSINSGPGKFGEEEEKEEELLFD